MLRTEIIGYLGRDAEVNETHGQAVINFNVCHTERYKKKDGTKVEKAHWVRCAYWRQKDSTGVAPYLTKGTLVRVEGMPSASHYERQDGTIADVLELKVKEVELLSRGHTGSSPAPAEEHGYTAGEEGGDDLPF